MNLMNRTARLLFVMVFGSVVAGASASVFTVATFADPAVDGTTPLFALEGNEFIGGWSGTNLNLLTPGLPIPDVHDASFAMTPLAATWISPGSWNLSAGEIRFSDAGNNTVLVITFDSAMLTSSTFSASDLYLQNVVFTGPFETHLWDESFAFSLANPVPIANGTTWTASFTSSAAPEPACIAIIMLSGLVLSRRR